MMDGFLTSIRHLLVPCCNFPHLLIPRCGTCITDALISLGEEEFVLWRYWQNPSANYVDPGAPLRVESSTPYTLALQWKDEAYGASFPELFYLPSHTSELVYRWLSESCRIDQLSTLPEARAAKPLRRALKNIKWAIAPLSVESFDHDEPTQYCLVIAQEEEQIREVDSAMSELDIRTFQLGRTLSDWPVPYECEDKALRLWEQEVALGWESRERWWWESQDR